MTTSDKAPHAEHDKTPAPITISIDGEGYAVHAEKVDGAYLRALPQPDIGDDRDLYLERGGHHEDRLIQLHDHVKLEGGMVFFTAPAEISPGHAA